MKLFYWGDRPELPANFGDQLNPWLWPRVLPELFGPTATGPSNSEESRPALFLGIGTVLNSAIPPDAAEYVVLGAGAGYGELPTIDERWRIHAVRGPLTARELGLDGSVAVVDPAVLVPSVLEQSPEPVRTLRHATAAPPARIWSQVALVSTRIMPTAPAESAQAAAPSWARVRPRSSAGWIGDRGESGDWRSNPGTSTPRAPGRIARLSQNAAPITAAARAAATDAKSLTSRAAIEAR